MKKNFIFLIFFLSTTIFPSCFLNSISATKQEILKNICVQDNSYIGLLNFCNFSGTVSNKNNFTVNNIELKGTLYNTETKTRSVHQFKMRVSITPNGSATYNEKIFVGKCTRIEKIEVIDAEQGY